MRPNPVLFTAEDVNSCSWGANCGPGALAGVLGMTLEQVRPHMGDFESKNYTNPRLMLSALKSLEQKYSVNKVLWPKLGLVRVQWCGPWTKDGVSPRAKLRHTHWIGAQALPYDDVWIFDINCVCVGGWVSYSEWANKVVPWLLREVEPEANRKWYPTHILELEQRR